MHLWKELFNSCCIIYTSVSHINWCYHLWDKESQKTVTVMVALLSLVVSYFGYGYNATMFKCTMPKSSKTIYVRNLERENNKTNVKSSHLIIVQSHRGKLKFLTELFLSQIINKIFDCCSHVYDTITCRPEICICAYVYTKFWLLSVKSVFWIIHEKLN